MSSNKEAPIYNNYSIQGLSKCMKKKLYHLLSYKTCCVNTKIRAINNVHLAINNAHLASNSTISIPHTIILLCVSSSPTDATETNQSREEKKNF